MLEISAGRQRIDHELGRVFREQDDVDAFARQLVGHRGDARAAHADARTLRIEPRIVRLDGDLGANAGITGGSLDFDETFLDLRYFKFEQAHDQIRRDPGKDELRPAGLRLDLHHVRAHAVAHAQILLRDQLIARNHAFDAPGFDDCRPALDALDGAGEQVVVALEKVVQDLLTLGVADFLQDHLLRRLRADAAEFDGFERLLDDVTELEFGVTVSGVRNRDLMRGLFVLFIGHDSPAPERLVVAGFAVDFDARVDVLRKALLGCRGERRLQRREDDVFRHVLFTCKGVDEKQ